jgi:hypothetical protein
MKIPIPSGIMEENVALCPLEDQLKPRSCLC